MLNPKGVKIWRPRQLYVGEGERDYVTIETRNEVDPTPTSSPTEVSIRLWKTFLLVSHFELNSLCVHLFTTGTTSLLETSFPRGVQE